MSTQPGRPSSTKVPVYMSTSTRFGIPVLYWPVFFYFCILLAPAVSSLYVVAWWEVTAGPPAVSFHPPSTFHPFLLYFLPASASDPCWEGYDLTMTSGFEFLLFPVGSNNWVVFTKPTSAKLNEAKGVKVSYRSVLLNVLCVDGPLPVMSLDSASISFSQRHSVLRYGRE